MPQAYDLSALDARSSDMVSNWIFLSKSQATLDHPKIKEAAQALPSKPGVKAWVDDFPHRVAGRAANFFDALRIALLTAQ